MRAKRFINVSQNKSKIEFNIGIFKYEFVLFIPIRTKK